MRVFLLILVIFWFVFSIRCQECRVFNASSINEENYWGVSLPEAEDRLLQMISDNVTCAVDCVLLKFLYVKGVFSSSHPLIRKAQFELVMNPEQAGSNELVKHYSEVRERLSRIVAPDGDITANEIPDDVQRFDQAMKAMQNWNQDIGSDEIHIFHLHDDKVQGRDVLVQRVQRSSLCYLHAPAVLSHYLVSRNNFTDPSTMINIALHVAGSFDGKALAEHIFGDRGDSSIKLLKTFLAPASKCKIWDIEDINIRTFELHGPALVSGFEVFDDFKTDDKIHYEGLPRGQSWGYHAMVMLGMKTKPVRTFILQNWWSRKQFISVSEEYLKATGPTIYFVTTPQTSIPACFSTHSFRYAETLLLDRPERLLEERSRRDEALHLNSLPVGG